jgi:glutamate racemase
VIDHQKKPQRPIGIFDSGVGGLTVLREVRRQLPAENLIYLADQAHVPYGQRSREQVLDYSKSITRFLLNQGVKLVIVACNTASAVALAELRKIYPSIPFVGMEPAVKPAAEDTSSGVVGVLATPATFQGDLYASTVAKFARGVKILQNTCPGLVAEIEAGRLAGPETRRILENALRPMIDQGVDEVVMGCTHYPFVMSIIEEIAGKDIKIIDPAPAVARQAGRLLREFDLLNSQPEQGENQLTTTGDPGDFSRMVKVLLELDQEVVGLQWVKGKLQLSEN